MKRLSAQKSNVKDVDRRLGQDRQGVAPCGVGMDKIHVSHLQERHDDGVASSVQTRYAQDGYHRLALTC